MHICQSISNTCKMPKVIFKLQGGKMEQKNYVILKLQKL
jgi:hypothetical protein